MSKKPFILIIILLGAAIIILGIAKKIQRNDLPGPVSRFAPNATEIVNKKEIVIGSEKLLVEVADTPEAWAKGLGGREQLAENEGMIFVFPNANFYSFWMKGMKFGLDFIWIKGDKIIDITQNVLPPKDAFDQLPIYQPKQIIDKVLEVNAGWVERHRVTIGDNVKM